MILCKKRNKLKDYLQEQGIETKIHYPIPLHKQKPAKIYKFKKNEFKTAEYQSKHLLTLPVHQFLNRKQLSYMVKMIGNFYKI